MTLRPQFLITRTVTVKCGRCGATETGNELSRARFIRTHTCPRTPRKDAA